MIIDNKNYYDDEKKLLEVFLNEFLHLPPKSNNKESYKGYTFSDEKGLELIVRPDCNQKCEYCYIYKYGKELYPLHTRKNNEVLIKNLRALLDYFIKERKFIFRRIELFAGDLFYDNLYFDIMDIFYEYYKPLYRLFPNDFNERDYLIIIPCNFSFVEDDEKVKKVISYYKKFKQDLNITLGFSWSSDGFYAVDTREKRNLDEEYFNKIFRVCKQLDCGAHPMIAPENVEYAIQNYDWWVEKFNEFELSRPDDKHDSEFQPMFLEVRNDGWTEEKINLYLQFLKHMIEKRLEMCGNDIDRLARNLWYDSLHNGIKEEGDIPKLNNYDPIVLTNTHNDFNFGMNDRISCSMQNLLHVSLADLSLSICHRLTYKQFLGGWFKTNEENKIIDLIPNNVTSLISAKTMKVNYAPQCITCFANKVCLKGCLGAQYEVHGEYLMPIESVCNLEKAKASFLAKTYCELGVIQSALKQNLFDEGLKDSILEYCDIMGYSYE